MAAQSRVVLYGNGLFTDPNPQVNQQQLQAIQNSGFNTVVMWTLHVDPAGNLGYNTSSYTVENGVVNSQFLAVAPYIAQLREGGVATILFSIGSAFVKDYHHIAALLQSQQGTQTLMQNLAAVTKAMGTDGFDLDLEEFDQDYRPAVIQLTGLLSQSGLVTYCPYRDYTEWTQTFWEDCLAGAYHNNKGVQPVDWYNLQCYSGGASNTGAQWAQQIKQYPKPLGISDANAFVAPGYAAAAQSPASIKQTFTGQHVGGGFIWNSGDIFKAANPTYTPAEYAQAIIAALGLAHKRKSSAAY